MSINVLSLFDGISCGRIALQRCGISVCNYFASEIDNNAIKVSRHNWQGITHIGDVTKVSYKDGTLYTEYGEFESKIDLVIGGSPCQGFSSIGSQLNFEDERSKLFFEFVRLCNETGARHFLLENVPMNKNCISQIDALLKTGSVLINSSLVSAQNRKRLYWTNISGLQQPKDRGIFLDDVIDRSFVGKVPKNWQLRVPASLPKYVDPYNKSELVNKSNTLRTNVHNGNMWIKQKDGYRNLTARECEILQTVPVGYCSVVSDVCAKKLLGNGWTVDVISHIFNKLKEE